jgi:hypothetical protein
MAWRRRNRAVLVVGLVILTHWAAHAVLGATERSRLPIEPLVILVAFYGLAEVFRAVRSRASDGLDASSPVGS